MHRDQESVFGQGNGSTKLSIQRIPAFGPDTNFGHADSSCQDARSDLVKTVVGEAERALNDNNLWYSRVASWLIPRELNDANTRPTASDDQFIKGAEASKLANADGGIVVNTDADRTETQASSLCFICQLFLTSDNKLMKFR
jgi:hypothetical protein